MIARAKVTDWQVRFVSMLPSIRRTAAFQLAGLDPEAKDDAMAEIVANCYVAYFRLVELGKESLAYPSVLARYAISQYRAGRRVGTRARRNDVYAPYCRKKNGHELCHIGAPADQVGGWHEYLTDNAVSPVPDQVAFRIDFPNWLSTLSARTRQVVEELADGERVTEVSQRLEITPSRVSQLRRELHAAWQKFQGEDIEPVLQGS
jgi:hypothetical protein